MSVTDSNDQMAGYTEAVKSGLYAKRTGLVGKYDNVRRYWEDEVARMDIRPYLSKLIDRCSQEFRRLRILDLGCGSADGFELLTGVRQREADLHDMEIDLITPAVLGHYKGVDLNEDLLAQARQIYGGNPKMQFVKGDFTKGLPVASDEKPYDFYFSSYGTCSHHNDDRTMVRLLAEIAERTPSYSLVVCDWLGRYSYEWQTLWTDNPPKMKNMDYVVSYIYEEKEREARRDELQHLKLRLMSRGEAEHIVEEAARRSGVAIRPLAFFDRSVFTGRHMDTREYNAHGQPVRHAVNSLHEANTRTDLNSLMLDYVPKPGFDFLNEYFEHLQMCWNTLVRYTMDLLDSYDPAQRAFEREANSIPASYPEEVRAMMVRLKSVVEGVGWLRIGLPRENIIEPQLGYALRHLMMTLQQGRGCGHSFMGVFEIDKSA
jgi:SAM-dependent methyltransferase